MSLDTQSSALAWSSLRPVPCPANEGIFAGRALDPAGFLHEALLVLLYPTNVQGFWEEGLVSSVPCPRLCHPVGHSYPVLSIGL